MKFHPDVLRCHEQFGGDLEDMQRRYDAPDALPASKESEAVALYREKSTFRAWQLTPELAAAALFDEVPLPDHVRMSSAQTHPGRREINSARFRTEGFHVAEYAEVGDWIMFGDGGKAWPCKPDVFNGKYERTHPPTDAGVSEAITEAMQICVDLLLLAELIGDKRFGAIVTEGAVQQLERADAFLQRFIGKELAAAALSTAIPAGDGAPLAKAIKLKMATPAFKQLAQWEAVDPETLFYIPVRLGGPCSVTCWYVEMPSGKTCIIEASDYAELVPLSTASTAGKGIRP